MRRPSSFGVDVIVLATLVAAMMVFFLYFVVTSMTL